MNTLTNVSYSRVDSQSEVRRRRILFRSWNRGTQESDLILGSFAEKSLASLDSVQVDRLEALLDCSDPDLFDWIYGAVAPPAQHNHDVMRLLRDFCVDRQIIPQPKQQARA
jgi:antitoxin CptB